MNNPFLDAALRYAGRGWHVFPLFGIVESRCECQTNCGSPGKHPRLSGGLLNASNDERVIKTWWKRWPSSNVGIRTGGVSGIYVIDVDNKRSVDLGNGILVSEGENSLREKALDLGSLPDTLTSQTGSGGLHLLYSYPITDLEKKELLVQENATFGNRAGILPSVDTRGDGGYIVGPPSLHQSGNLYRWIEEDQPIASLPDGWMTFLKSSSSESCKISLENLDGLIIREGEGRHDWLFRMGAKLRGQNGLEGIALLGALAFYNEAVLRPVLENEEVAHIAESVSKYPAEIQRGDLAQESSSLSIEESADVAVSLGQLLAKDIPPFVEVIDGLLNKGEMMILGGPPNVGKTWVAMDMMMAIASGQKFLNHFPTTQMPVLFIDEEGSERGNKARFSMLLEGREDFSADDIPIHTKIGSGLRLDSPSGRAAISRLLERYRPGVVFLDSLVRVHGGEENSSRAMADFFRMCKRLMDSYGCSFVFTHHIRKPGSDPAKDDPAYMLRGSGDIQGFPDSILVCLPTTDATEMQVYHTKMRHGERLPVFSVGLQLIDRADSGIPTAKLGYRDYDPASHAQKARDTINKVLLPGSTMTAEQIAFKLGMSLPTVKEHLKVLEAGDAIRFQREAGKVYYYRQTGF